MAQPSRDVENHLLFEIAWEVANKGEAGFPIAGSSSPSPLLSVAVFFFLPSLLCFLLPNLAWLSPLSTAVRRKIAWNPGVRPSRPGLMVV